MTLTPEEFTRILTMVEDDCSPWSQRNAGAAKAINQCIVDNSVAVFSMVLRNLYLPTHTMNSQAGQCLGMTDSPGWSYLLQNSFLCRTSRRDICFYVLGASSMPCNTCA